MTLTQQAKADLAEVGPEQFETMVEEIEINLGRHSAYAKAYRKVRDAQ